MFFFLGWTINSDLWRKYFRLLSEKSKPAMCYWIKVNRVQSQWYPSTWHDLLDWTFRGIFSLVPSNSLSSLYNIIQCLRLKSLCGIFDDAWFTPALPSGTSTKFYEWMRFFAFAKLILLLKSLVEIRNISAVSLDTLIIL